MDKKMKTMMFEVATDSRKTLLEFREKAFEQVHTAEQQANFDCAMFNVMNLAFWLRADLELLLRVAYWQNLSENDLGARFISDQINFYETILKRMQIDKVKITDFLDDFTKIAENRTVVPLELENNAQIIEKLTYRKNELGKLHACSHKALSKFTHPEPFFLCFPERFREQIEVNLMNIFKQCRSQLDVEWRLLKEHLKPNEKETA